VCVTPDTQYPPIHLLPPLTQKTQKPCTAKNSDPAVAHALKIRQALQADNYHSFFQLYLKTPNMGTYILDLMVENLRAATLVKICKVYKPTVEADFVLKELAFTDKQIGLEFMQKVGCKIEKDRERWVWNTKDSVVDVSALVTETKLLL
jgi:hypothetical protein